MRKMYEILDRAQGGGKTLIFTATKRDCDSLCRALKQDRFDALPIHGDKTQKERDYVLDMYKRGKVSMLVATDVASRGLDVKDITTVINYDFPQNPEDYVHRIGRTGRAGALGVSYTFFTRDDSKKARALISILQQSNQEVPSALRDLAAMGDRFGGGGSRFGGGGRFGGRGGGMGGRGGGMGGGYSSMASGSRHSRSSRSRSPRRDYGDRGGRDRRSRSRSRSPRRDRSRSPPRNDRWGSSSSSSSSSSRSTYTPLPPPPVSVAPSMYSAPPMPAYPPPAPYSGRY
eukprot:TRINITY_DN847_c0_g2_i2.p1 TRINITY_DN847_c0_g2~~TRINITY_DN847_c0_g2_i2.p1  ORF type:complete len:287 (-),score=50.50 TRINITY_DN847_c0_g2_i2:172-1032(-)